MNFKLSHYRVLSDPIDKNGRRILLSTRTGRSIIITQNCLDYLNEGRMEDLPQKTVDKLKELQAIVPEEENELQTIASENKTATQDDSGTLYEVMQPSAMCQLGCYYCGQKHTKNQMDSSLFEKIEQRIRAKAAAGNFTHLSIGWFGAEPLMGFRQMRELTARFKKIATDFDMSYSAKIVTNGLSLKENIFDELTRELNVNSIEITLDGPAVFHDRHRYTKEGGKSFDIIYQNLVSILNKPDFESHHCGITIRCNVDESNVDGVTPLITLLSHENLQRKISNFYPIGIYSWGNDAHKKSLTKEDFAKKELVWIVQKIKHNFKRYSLLPNRVKQVCFSVSKTSEMYDAFGNIFDCSEVSYVPQYENSIHRLGNLKTDATAKLSRSKLNDWNDDLLTSKFPCHTCEMLPVCGGGCPKSWHEDMRACPPNKFNIKDKLLLSYVLNQATKAASQNRLDEILELYPQSEWAQELKTVFENDAHQSDISHG